VPPEAGTLKRCEKHGLNFDSRLTRGCVLCRRTSDDPGAAQKSTQYTLSGFALIAALGVFGWIYVKPLIMPEDEARHSYVGLSQDPSDGRPRTEHEAKKDGASAKPEATTPAPALHPKNEALWSEVARDFEPYDGSEPIVEELRSGYGVHVHVPRTPRLDLEHGRLTGARPEQAQIAAAARALVDELSRYPRPFVKELGLQQLVLVSELRHKGEAVGAFAMGPAFALFANPQTLSGDAALHHELFHFVDYRLHGMPANHREWIALNPAGTRYRGGGRAVMRQTGAGSTRLNALRRDLPGFATEYAQADASEDMAEVFSLLMTQRPELYQLTTTDTVIAAKVTYVIQALDKIAPGTSAALNL
jgi:hypothetical protein